MGTRNEFIAQLKKAIENKKEEFDKKILPDTLKNYNIQISAVQAIRSILLKKSLIHNDPYKYDNKMTEIEIPSKESFRLSSCPLRNNAGIFKQLLSV